MRRFSGHSEPWGHFLDVKINAAEVLQREVRRKAPGRVFFSSVCDPYQPAESRYQISRACLSILLEAGFYPSILTKSKLVRRDFDILKAYENCEVGCTLTTMDENLRFRIEPGSSPTRERIAVLEEACSLGIKTYAFLGPFMPGLSDTDDALDALISAVAQLPLTHFYADKLNPRPGVSYSVLRLVQRCYPSLMGLYRRLLFDEDHYEDYCASLGRRLRHIAAANGIADKLKMAF